MLHYRYNFAMKKTFFTLLVMPYENKYMALCKETGIVRAGNTPEEARDAVFSATKMLFEAVSRDSKLQPSLRVGLPLRYRLLFNWTVFKMFTHLFTRNATKKFLYQTQPIQTFNSTLAPA